ncbi:fungal-specific transcription factor domain-containing protein [Aspergillus ambiguus]|uniref:Zn(II)2Cys6 transcription factor n=1 Tax=Aspergillus ambiguus TaxID=176160 RepID=UPI003CCD7230
MARKQTRGKKPRRVRGCYNCSQRRINCDRGTPKCQKCIKKGLECLGLGTRYRFQNAVASRGKLAGRTVPSRNVNGQTYVSQLSDDTTAAQAEAGNNVHNDVRFDGFCRRVLDHIDPQSRFLLQYFSDSVAPAMAPVNVIFNGYRDLILPLTERDEIVRHAVMAAASYHLGLHQAGWNNIAIRHHMAAIQGLGQRRYEQNIDESTLYSRLSTMLLLLIEEMITGQKGRDFRILLRMIKSFVESQGGEERIEWNSQGKFFIQEIRKMNLYSTPLVSEELARCCLANISRKDLWFLHAILESHPEHSPTILKLIRLVRKASGIYIARATNIPQQGIDKLVHGFISETSEFSAISPGGHILIWPFFIVGAECSRADDQDFIVNQLQHLWRQTGFANTLYAIEVLREVWKDRGGIPWTEAMVNKVEVFVM